MYKNVLWIDPSVRDYQVFIDSVNADTLPLVFPEPLRLDVERIAFVFEKGGAMATYLLENAALLVSSGVKTMDFLACETLPEWQPFYDKLIGIQVGASNNKTGNLLYGGDWILESTCEDIEPIYFTKSIQYYHYLLGSNAYATFVIDTAGNMWAGARALEGAYTLGFSGTLPAQLKQGKPNVTKMSVSYNNAFLIINGTVYSCGSRYIGRTGTANVFASIGLTGATEVSAGELTGYAIAGGFIYTFIDTEYSKLLIGGNDVRADRIRHFGLQGFIYLNDGMVYNHLGSQLSPDGVTIIEIAMGRYQVMAISDTNELYSGTNTAHTIVESITKVDGISKVNAISCGSTTNDYNLIIVDKQLYERVGSSGSFTMVTGMNNVTQIYSAETMRFAVHNNILYGAGSTQTDTTTGSIGSYSPMLKTNLTVMNTAAFLPDGHFVPLNVLNVSSIDKTVSIVNSSVNIYGTLFNTSTVSSISIGTTSIAYSILTPDNIQFRTPNLLLTNTSVTLYTRSTQFLVTSAFTIPPLFSISGYNTSTSFTNDTIKIYGSNFSNMSYAQFRNIQRIVTNVSSTQLNVTIPDGISGNVSILVGDIYGNTSSISDTIVVAYIPNMSHAIQVEDQATLVGKELTGLDIGFPLIFPSETVPIYRGYINGSVNVISEGITTNVSVRTYPVTVTQSNLNESNPDIVTVRGMPYGKMPDSFGIKDRVEPTVDNLVNPSIVALSGWTKVPTSNPLTNQPLFDNPTFSYNTATTVLTITLKKRYTLKKYEDIIVNLYNNIGQNIVIVKLIPKKAVAIGTVNVTYNVTGWYGILEGKTGYILRYQVSKLTQTNSTDILKLYQDFILDITGPKNIMFPIPSSIHATCYFGYFKPTTSMPHTFTLTSTQAANLRIGASLYDLRSEGTSLVNLNSNQDTVSSVASLVNTTQYAVLLTYVNPYSSTMTLDCDVTAVNTSTILSYCTTDKNTNGLFFYTLNESLLRSTLSGISALSSTNVLDRISRIYSSTWAYGNLGLQTFWSNTNSIPLVEGSGLIRTSRLTVTNAVVVGSNITIHGMGLHSNVSVFVNNIEKTKTFNGNISVAGTSYTNILLMDGLVTSNLFTGSGVTSIEKTTAIRNSSVNLYGKVLSTATIASIKIGTVDTSYVFLSDTTIQMRVPNSTQTDAPLFIYSPENTFYTMTSFTIPPPFSITGYNTSIAVPNMSLEITGSDFMNLSYVKFSTTNVDISSTNVRISSFNTSTLVVKVPPLLGNVSVMVYDEYENSSSISTQLSIVNLNPQSVTSNVSGGPIQISGQNFYNVTHINFSGRVIRFSDAYNLSYTTTTIGFNVPLQTGNISIGIYDLYGNNASISYVATPLFSITRYNPSSVTPNTILQMTGDNISNISYALIGTKKVFPIDQSNTYVNVSVPTRIPNNVSVTVFDIYNNRSSISSDLNIRNLSIGAVLPDKSYSGASITLVGDNLDNTSFVVFGNVSVPYNTRSNTSVTVTVPTSSLNGLTLYDIYGNNLSASFTYINTLQITTQNPSAIQKRTLLLEGINLYDIYAVYFGDVSASFTYNSVNLSVIVPVQSIANCSLVVYDIYNNNSSVSFTYNKTSIHSILPSSGPAQRTVQVLGDYLLDLSYVVFGNTSLSILSEGNGSFNVSVPLGEGIQTISLYDTYNNITTFTGYTYENMSLTRMNPDQGPPQSLMNLEGVYFQNLSAVYFGTTQAPILSFGNGSLNVSVPFLTKVSGTQTVTVYDLYGNTTSGSYEYQYPSLSNLSSAPKNASIELSGQYLSNTSYLMFGGERIVPSLINGSWYIKIPIGSEPTTVTVTDRTETSPPLNCLRIEIRRLKR